MTHRGAVNGRTFLRFVKTRLGPWLRPGDIVVMDNLNMHKMNAVRQFDIPTDPLQAAVLETDTTGVGRADFTVLGSR